MDHPLKLKTVERARVWLVERMPWTGQDGLRAVRHQEELPSNWDKSSQNNAACHVSGNSVTCQGNYCASPSVLGTILMVRTWRMREIMGLRA